MGLTKVWAHSFPPGAIQSVHLKPPTERVHSPGRVMADRSVLYKYVNPNLAVVVSQGHENPASECCMIKWYPTYGLKFSLIIGFQYNFTRTYNMKD